MFTFFNTNNRTTLLNRHHFFTMKYMKFETFSINFLSLQNRLKKKIKMNYMIYNKSSYKRDSFNINSRNDNAV